jgi:hypothetical protein
MKLQQLIMNRLDPLNPEKHLIEQRAIIDNLNHNINGSILSATEAELSDITTFQDLIENQQVANFAATDTSPSWGQLSTPPTIEQNTKAWHLNTGQTRAFKIIASHIIEDSTDQLLMIITGPPGVGKSRVIHVVGWFFHQHGKNDQSVHSHLLVVRQSTSICPISQPKRAADFSICAAEQKSSKGKCQKETYRLDLPQCDTSSRIKPERYLNSTWNIIHTSIHC